MNSQNSMAEFIKYILHIRNWFLWNIKMNRFVCHSIYCEHVNISIRWCREKSVGNIPVHVCFGQLFNHMSLYENAGGITRAVFFYFNLNLKIYELPCDKSCLNANGISKGKIRCMLVQSIEFEKKKKLTKIGPHHSRACQHIW